MRFKFCFSLELTTAPFAGLEFNSSSFSGLADATTFQLTPMIPRYMGMTVNIDVFMLSRKLDVYLTETQPRTVSVSAPSLLYVEVTTLIGMYESQDLRQLSALREVIRCTP